MALPRDAMLHCIKIGTFGRSQKHVLPSVEAGDKIACYVTGEKKIIALGEATEPYFYDESKIFASGNSAYPHRIRFQANRLNEEIDLVQYLDRLSFITNLAYWSVYFRLGFKEISQADWKLITRTA